MTEDQLKGAVIDLAEANGWLVYSIRRSDQARVQGRRKTGEGFPDLLMVHPVRGSMLAVELKSERGKVTPQQVRWLEAFGTVRHVSPGVWRPEHWLSGQVEDVLRFRPGAGRGVGVGEAHAGEEMVSHP